MIDFGKGLTLREACPWLRDDKARREAILDVVERNSAIEGLPPFNEETRRRIMEQLERIDSGLPPVPDESTIPSDRSPS